MWLCCHPRPWPCCCYCCAWETMADLPFTSESGSSFSSGWLLQLKGLLSCDTGSLETDAGHSTASCNQTVNGEFWERKLDPMVWQWPREGEKEISALCELWYNHPSPGQWCCSQSQWENIFVTAMLRTVCPPPPSNDTMEEAAGAAKQHQLALS